MDVNVHDTGLRAWRCTLELVDHTADIYIYVLIYNFILGSHAGWIPILLDSPSSPELDQRVST